ncbi:hypothetical protein BOTBODRAFT_177842 [Botryobasidium botryosum FD-172 SS1]|uniref:F-box domain-containing protein n=1 Tax=Botryobasidium botryosum (strain FD-172 SS1) TaxID=930990 RepID=A0A067M7S3_BOTB1|nr:hypothetical protein BOTBODRAFT_177842 [Botryobasidium botryosum FD-172 SS1]
MEAFTEQQKLLLSDFIDKMLAKSADSEEAEPKAPSAEAPDGVVPAPPVNDGLVASNRRLQLLAEAREYAVRVVDGMVESRRSELVTHHNRIVPIYRLPNEVFAIIFKFAHADAFDTLSRGGGENAESYARLHVGWCVSRVSSLWRQIAQGTARLWTLVNMPAPDFVETCVLRSQNLPLHIMLRDFAEAKIFSHFSVSRYEEKIKQCAPILVRHIARWQTLAFKDIRPVHYVGMFSDVAPQVEKLDICITPTPVERVQMIITPKTFTGLFPGLRELRLKTVTIPLSSTVYTNLVKLHLKFVTFPENTVGDLIRAFQASPLLEELVLSKTLFLGRDPTPPIANPVPLPHLKSIWLILLEAPLPKTILSSICAPPTLHIFGHSIFPPGWDLTDIIPSRDDIPNTVPCLLEITDLTFDFEAEPSIYKIEASSRSFDNFPTPFDFGFGPFQEWGSMDGHPKRAFLNLGAELPLPKLVALILYSVSSKFITKNVFVQVLSRFPEIEELEFHDCAPGYLACIDPGGLSFPNLRFLSLFDFTESYVGAGRPQTQMMTQKSLAAILTHLPTLEALTFTNCSPRLIRTLKSTRNKHLCPVLDELSVASCAISGMDLVALVKSRAKWGPEESLTTMQITDCEGVDEEAISQLEEIVDFVLHDLGEDSEGADL